jgi:hypothetical protein
VLEYYQVLRSLLRQQPHRRRCLTRCRHCRIFFFTDPRNTGRKDMPRGKRRDLGCPFGCREAHRQQQSSARSLAYYQSSQGRKKKRDLNQRRPAACRGQTPAPATTPSSPAPQPARTPWAEPVVAHVGMVVSWIEGRHLGRAEIRQLLAHVLRQQSIGRRRRIDHTVAWLNEHPP